MSIYPHDQPFIDSLLASSTSPSSARQAVKSYLIEKDQSLPKPGDKKSPTLLDAPKVWPPMIFIRWALPCFYQHTQKTGNFELIEAVINGMVDGINSCSQENWPTAGHLLATCVTMKRDSLFEVYNSKESQARLSGIFSRLPFPALSELTNGLLKKEDIKSSTDLMAPSGFPLADILIHSKPDLVSHIRLMDLLQGLRGVSGIDDQEIEAVSSISKKVFQYQLSPSNRSGFHLHLASASKSDLSTFSWGMSVLIKEAGWTPEDFSDLGDRRALRYLEKAITRAGTVSSTKQIKMPSPDSIHLVKSVIRNATLSNQEHPQKTSFAPRM